MSRGDERSRPAGNGPAKTSLTDADAIIASLDDISARDALLWQIYSLGPEALLAASLGWRLGRLDAEEIAKQRIGQAGVDVVASPEWHAIRRNPRWIELQRHRGECVKRHRLESCTCSAGGPS